MEVVVEDKQLSLAIGKKGQNVRLAAKLTGWRIDIKSEEEKRREVEAQFEGLEAGAADGIGRGRRSALPKKAPRLPGSSGDTDGSATPAQNDGDAAAQAESSEAPLPYTLPGVGEKTVRKLVDAGLTTVETIKGTSVEQLSEIPGIGEKTAAKILAAARGDAEAEESIG